MARESEAVRRAREFREQLIRQEDAALREMSRQWVRMENKLMDQYRLLVQDILDRQARGEAVPRQLIYNMERYQQMMAEIAKELPEYDARAVKIITNHQIESYTLGLDAAEAVIMDTRPSDPMWNRVGKDAAQITAGFAGNGAPLGQLLQRDYGDLGVKITDALVEGVALGKGAFATAKDMRDAMGMEYNRSVRIARTEINRAYRIANADQYAKSGVVTKVLRLCAKQANTCLACLMMDGDEVPNGVLDDHPNGRCATIAVTVGGIYPQWEHGDKWFEQQDEATQRAIMGPGRYEMWKKDGIDPHQMVMMKPNDVWGGSPTVISERELRERYNLTGGNRMLFDVKSAPAPEPPKPAQRVFEFTPAENIKDAEKYISQFVNDKQFGAVGVSYAGISLDVANEINRTIGKFYDEFDVEQFGGIIAPAGNTKLGKMMTNATAGWVDIRKSLLLNRSSLKTMEIAEKAFAEERKAIDNILNHPERYDFSRMSARLKRVIENSRLSGRGTVPDTIEEAINHELGHSIEKVVKKNPLWEQAKNNMTQYGQLISGYACEDTHEYIAESFCSYMKGETVIDPLMRTIFEGMKR